MVNNYCLFLTWDFGEPRFPTGNWSANCFLCVLFQQTWTNVVWGWVIHLPREVSAPISFQTLSRCGDHCLTGCQTGRDAAPMRLISSLRLKATRLSQRCNQDGGCLPRNFVRDLPQSRCKPCQTLPNLLVARGGGAWKLTWCPTSSCENPRGYLL